MTKPTRPMTRKLMAECIECIEDYGHIALTEPQFRELMLENPDLERTLKRFNSPGDTADREYMMEVLAVKIVGRSWPCNGEGTAVAIEFFANLKRMAAEKGYKFVSTE